MDCWNPGFLRYVKGGLLNPPFPSPVKLMPVSSQRGQSRIPIYMAYPTLATIICQVQNISCIDNIVCMW